MGSVAQSISGALFPTYVQSILGAALLDEPAVVREE